MTKCPYGNATLPDGAFQCQLRDDLRSGSEGYLAGRSSKWNGGDAGRARMGEEAPMPATKQRVRLTPSKR